jgi:hypothetical protein
MPSASATDSETQIDEASLPFDLTVFVSQRLSVSTDEATRLLAEWMREQRQAERRDLYNH